MKKICKILKPIQKRINSIGVILKQSSRKTDINRWKNVAKETFKWDERNEIIASFIQSGSSVLDIGAGAQTLKTHLKNYSEYLPCDIISRPGTLYCDLNNNIFPTINKKYDYVVCSGVIEYLINPLTVINHLASYGEKLIITYAPLIIGTEMDNRVISGWKNHFSRNQIEAILTDLGFSWSVLGQWHNQVIYLLR